MTMQAEEEETVWTPDLIGPIFKKRSHGLREVLIAHRDDKCTRSMATFVPDQLIHETDLSRKNFRKMKAVLALIDVSRLFSLYERYVSAENGGCYALITLLNEYLSVIVEEVYTTDGDVLKFSREGLLLLWKLDRHDFIANTVYNVILCGQRIQESVASVKSKEIPPKVDIAISAGEVIFSVIGDDEIRDFVIAGLPIDELKYARRTCLPGDLVLASSAWDHCAPSSFEYVIKDSNNVKIIKVLGPPQEPTNERTSVSVTATEIRESIVPFESTAELISTISEISVHSEEEITFHARVSVVEATKRNLGALLKTYMMKPVMEQITDDESLDYLMEVRRVTVLSINVIPTKSTVHELISLIDEIFRHLRSIIQEHSGCIPTINLYETDILFHVLYGVRAYSEHDFVDNTSVSGLSSASQIMKELKRIVGVDMVFIGVSTGMAFCGVLGHPVRKQYMVFGTPVDRATSLMLISFDKISCDYDTVSLSSMNKEKFRSRGLKTLSGLGKYQVYEFIDVSLRMEGSSNLDYSYPILDRFQEREYFKDILDDIGVAGRIYSGMLIEGAERSGKSRLLDSFATIVRNRQLQLVQLSLHESYAEKSYSVLYHILLQLFNAVDCRSIPDRQRVLLRELADILAPDEFCYLNSIMRVQFPLSKDYCEDNDWQRHTKTMKIFESILNTVVDYVCILLDDVQYMDLLSWQFLSSAISSKNVVLGMTLLEPVSWDNLSQVEVGICQDKRLMHRSLLGLGDKYLAAFACQFLNVIAIPRSLEKILQKRSKNLISWCEAFLMSALQTNALNFVTISPPEVDLHDLAFPDSSYVMKIPKDLTPEEVAPPLSWNQMNSLNVCVPSGMPIGFIETNRDVTGLRIDIYNRMNSYEQDLIKCAAILGSIFPRNMIETVLTNSTPLYTAKAIAEMIRLRILECGMIQRKHFHSDDSKYYLYKKRRTFSNMFHLVTCDCQPSRIFAHRTLPREAHCRVLEFTIASYHKFFYDILSEHERKDYHTKAASIFGRDARRCSTCGGNSFLTIALKEDDKSMQELLVKSPSNPSLGRRGTLLDRDHRVAARKSVFITDSNNMSKKRESIRRISVLPVHITDDEGETSGNDLEPARERDLNDFPKMAPEGSEEVSWEARLKQFGYIDYRNCRCMDVVNYLFWQLHHHIENSNNEGKLKKFTLEYTAALIETAQPLHATKYLARFSANTEVARMRTQIFDGGLESFAETGKCLVLMGDAYFVGGNYSQARRFYTSAVALQSMPLLTNKAICYNAVKEKLRHILRGFPDYDLNRISGELAANNLHLSIYLQRLSTVLMLQNISKPARLTVLQGLRVAFESVGGFLEKGRIYLTAVEIFRQIGDLELIQPLEEPMMWIIENKIVWYRGEELVLVAKVYQTMYETRLLEGKLKEAIKFGSKVLRICNGLKIVDLKLSVLPSLIEIMLWTKHLHEAVDLLRELYFLSEEDIDHSAITWYYALCLEFHLDAGMIIETYDACYKFHSKISAYKTKSCVSRDPQSLSRLTTCLGIWQLRMMIVVTDEHVQDVDTFVKGIRHYKFAQIFNCIKGLEGYLLILKRRINIKKSNDLFDRVQNANIIIRAIRRVFHDAPVVKPSLYLLQSYMNLLRGRRSLCQQNLRKSEHWSLDQENKLMLAWIEQNKRTWKEANHNTMGQYWVENVNAADVVQWQEIHNFSVQTWSTIMYPLPVPDSNF